MWYNSVVQESSADWGAQSHSISPVNAADKGHSCLDRLCDWRKSIIMAQRASGKRSQSSVSIKTFSPNVFGVSYNVWVHVLGVCVEIELKLDWSGWKKLNIFKSCT